MPKRFILTGGGGKLGSVLQTLIPCDAPSHAQLDILNTHQLEQTFKSGKYDTVIHLAAISNQKQAETDKPRSYQTNVLGTRQVATIAARHGIKVVYLSTDYVFDGLAGDYREDSRASPANWYGYTKYAGELEVQFVQGPHCIIRTSFRPSDWGFPTAYTNVFTSADYTDVIAAEICRALELDLRGLIHIGTATKTFYELASRRNPSIRPEECSDPTFPKRRNLNIDRWLSLKKGTLCES